jgi:phage terminase large subunit
VWLDWNPVSEFWFYTDVKGASDVDFMILTYKDNEALEKSIIDSIESRRNNKNWWLVYGEGQLGEAEGRIYTSWKELDELPQEVKLVRYGLDFGYTNDPTAIVGVYKWNDARIYDEIIYQKRLSNKDIADIILSQPEKALVIGDSSEPKSIDEIASYGVNIIGAKKGKDSILQGIQYVQSQNVFITKRSTNIMKEYRNYLWMTNPDGKIINEAQDFLNHTMDAIRYAEDYTNRPTIYNQTTDVGGIQPFIEGMLA